MDPTSSNVLSSAVEPCDRVLKFGDKETAWSLARFPRSGEHQSTEGGGPWDRPETRGLKTWPSGGVGRRLGAMTRGWPGAWTGRGGALGSTSGMPGHWWRTG